MTFFEKKHCEICNRIQGHVNGRCGNCGIKSKKKELEKLNEEFENTWNSIPQKEIIRDLFFRVKRLEQGKS